MARFLFILFFFSAICQGFSQEINRTYIDSVISTAITEKDLSAKKNILDRMCSKIIRLRPEESLVHFQYMDSVYTNRKDLLVFIYMHAAPSLINTGNINASKEMRQTGLRWAKELDFPDSKFDFNQSLASFYVNTSVADSATFYVNEAEKVIQKHPDKLGGLLWQIYYRKGDIQVLLGDSDKQAYWYEKAWEELSKYPKHTARGFFLYLITDFYHDQKNHVKQAAYAELLIAYYNEKELNTPDHHFPVEAVLLNEYNTENIAYLKRVIEASDSLNNYNAYSTSAYVLSKALLENGRAEEAIPIMKKSLEKLVGANYLFGHSREKIMLENLYVTTGDFKSAYYMLQDLKQMEDSLRSQEVMRNISDYEVKYDTERKERELEQQEDAKKTSNLVLGSVAILLLVVSFFLYKNRRKNLLLAKQKKLLEATVDEKNVLLKETHHRVKNSFQIVSSLLYLQSENIEDKEAQIAIKEAQNRVRSMVLIHQKLYNKDQLVGINTEEYIQDLTTDIFDSHQSEQKINYSLDVQPLILDIESITPIGLILNELITNVLKHAFETITSESTMNIEFKKAGDTIVMKVSDNGQGMASEIREGSFGIKLMKALAKKLKAVLTFEAETPKGTLATLQIHQFTEL